MTLRGFWLGLLCASGTPLMLVDCSSSSSDAAMSGAGTASAGDTAMSSAGTSSPGSAAMSGGGTSASGGACTPVYGCKPVAPNTGDPAADCVARVNQFRACACKPALANDTEGKACADQQAMYDALKNTAHAGFGANICKPQFFAQNECPGYGSVQDTIDGCAQQMYDEGPPPTATCEGTCYQTHGHFINMTGNYAQVTCGFYTTADGKVWTVQNYR